MLIDSSDIVKLNDEHLRSSPWVLENISLGNACMDVLLIACSLPLTEDEQIAMLRLAIRLINSGGAGGLAALNGYYAQAVAHVRDVIEVGFLLDYFRTDPAEISHWLTCTDKVRRNDFAARTLRTKLDQRDAAKSKRRDDAYSFFSKHGTHVDPSALQMTSPNNLSQIGPFPDRVRVQALSFDLSRYLAAGTGYFLSWLGTQQNAIPPLKANELNRAWTAFNEHLAYLNTRSTPPPRRAD